MMGTNCLHMVAQYGAGDNGTELETVEPHNHNQSTAANPDEATVQVTGDTVRIQIKYDDPLIDNFAVECDVETRFVNKFARFTTYCNSEHKSTYDRYVAKRIAVLYREDGEWHYRVPRTPYEVINKAQYPQSDLDPDGHLPTQVDGVTKSQIADSDGVRKHQYKVTREFIKQVDTAFVLEWEEQHEAGREGAYTNRSQTVAYKLEREE